MAALQRMMGDTELTVENIRVAMQSLTPEQRQELLSESAEFKQDLLTKKEHTEERNLFRKEFNQETEKAGMPIDKDGMFLAKKVRLRCKPMPMRLHPPWRRHGSRELQSWASAQRARTAQLLLA